jgi:hypothetical protein
MRSLLALIVFVLAACPFPVDAAGEYASLVQLAEDWRQFEQPAIHDCVPDYSAAAMSAKAEGLASYRRRLTAIDVQGWPAARLFFLQGAAREPLGLFSHDYHWIELGRRLPDVAPRAYPPQGRRFHRVCAL